MPGGFSCRMRLALLAVIAGVTLVAFFAAEVYVRQTRTKIDLLSLTGKRWTPSLGQFGGVAKVVSESCRHAAVSWVRAPGRCPVLVNGSMPRYASSGVRSSSDECGRSWL